MGVTQIIADIVYASFLSCDCLDPAFLFLKIKKPLCSQCGGCHCSAGMQGAVLLLLHGEGASAVSGVVEQVCTPQQPTCSEKSSCMWKRAWSCPAENPSRKQEQGGSLLQSITFHIPHFFTSDPKIGQHWHKSKTVRGVQNQASDTRNPASGPCSCMLTTCRGAVSCLHLTLMTIKQTLLKSLSEMQIVNSLQLPT